MSFVTGKGRLVIRMSLVIGGATWVPVCGKEASASSRVYKLVQIFSPGEVKCPSCEVALIVSRDLSADISRREIATSTIIQLPFLFKEKESMKEATVCFCVLMHPRISILQLKPPTFHIEV
jgi:hypothetical protein